jgi:hypothetical protein
VQPEPIAVTLLVVDVLESLGVPYFIGGSLASAVHGVVRATVDADVVAELGAEHIEPLARGLSDAFYVDLDIGRRAIQQRGSFNVVHLTSAFKVDIFVAKERAFDRMQLERRMLQSIGVEPGRTAYFATPEDIILSKLEWYRMGGEVSVRQWNDAVGVLKVQGERLDRDYLSRWASELAVEDLLDRARAEAELEGG